MKQTLTVLVLALSLVVAYAVGSHAQSNSHRFTPLLFNDLGGLRIWVIRDDALAQRAVTAVPPGDTNTGCFYVVQSGTGSVAIQPTPDGSCW